MANAWLLSFYCTLRGWDKTIHNTYSTTSSKSSDMFIAISLRPHYGPISCLIYIEEYEEKLLLFQL